MAERPPGRVEPADYDAAFGAVLLDPGRPDPAIVGSAFGGVATKRFAVYRNNVAVGLIDTMASIFPAVRRLLGELNFRAVAGEFVRARPPSSPLLFLYGRGFPAFLESFEPLRHLPYLPGVARLELAWLAAYHAADAAPLDPALLGRLSPEATASVRFAAHPAFALVRSSYAVATIFTVNRAEAEPGRVNAGIAENALVTRPGLDVQVRQVPDGVAAFIVALAAGETLQDASEAASDEAADFDLSSAIVAALESGTFTSVVS